MSKLFATTTMISVITPRVSYLLVISVISATTKYGHSKDVLGTPRDDLGNLERAWAPLGDVQIVPRTS